MEAAAQDTQGSGKLLSADGTNSRQFSSLEAFCRKCGNQIEDVAASKLFCSEHDPTKSKVSLDKPSPPSEPRKEAEFPMELLSPPGANPGKTCRRCGEEIKTGMFCEEHQSSQPTRSSEQPKPEKKDTKWEGEVFDEDECDFGDAILTISGLLGSSRRITSSPCSCLPIRGSCSRARTRRAYSTG